MQPFDLLELLDAARERTGLKDFGPPDFMEGLAIFIDSVNSQGEIIGDRQPALKEHLTRLLVNRLWFADDLTQHPEILDQDVSRPVVIVSLPRTGSTKMHRMLGAGPNFLTVKMWQACMFARIPGLEDGGQARRIQETREYEQWMYRVSPKTITGHPMFTDDPEEDQMLVEAAFRHTYIGGKFNVPSYSEWLARADMRPTYEYLLLQVKYLQWQMRLSRPKPWLLKTPDHLGKETLLAETFSDPRIIITHRDPVQCVASIFHPVQHMRRLYSDRDVSPSLAAALIHSFSQCAAEHVRWRKSHPSARVLDLSYREINEDGLSAVRKVYEFLELSLSSAAENAMLDWQRRNSKDAHGVNSYSIADLGIPEREIRRSFAPYLERYSDFI